VLARDLGDLEPWLQGRGRVMRAGGSIVELSAATLPPEEIILVFEHSPRIIPGGTPVP